jgi:SAM-dependent methyltransferase
MTETQIRFDDGAGYERMMGTWSRMIGEVFLEWLAAPSGRSWIDVGCGNGAFTELIVERCAPVAVEGVDPSDAQLDFARSRPAGRVAQFRQGDAQALPFAAGTFDAAVMALVIFFVPDPVKGVAEMVRVVRPGGIVAAYAWDVLGGGFPQEPIRAGLRAMGLKPVNPPTVDASQVKVMRDLWIGAGLEGVETREITAQRSFADFEEFWDISMLGASLRPTVATMSPADVERLKELVRANLLADAAGRITCGARANAVKGRLPGQLRRQPI